MNRVKTSLSHLVIKPSANIVTNRQDDPIPLNELAWSEFIGNRNVIIMILPLRLPLPLDYHYHYH